MELEEVIKEFHKLAKELEQNPSLTAEIALVSIINFYRETRIANTVLEDYDDMLLLEWGTMKPFTADTPFDLRKLADRRVSFEETEYRYLEFTRQVHQSVFDTEFDDEAIQMRLTLLYGEASGNEKSSNQWIERPEYIEEALLSYYQRDFVKEHLQLPVNRLYTVVDYCG